MDQLHEIRTLVRRHGQEGATLTSVPGLTLYVASRPTDPIPVIYKPLLCVVVDGAKRTLLGDRVFRYDAGAFLTVTVDLPVTGQVVAAPYAALSLALDPAKIATLAMEAAQAGAAPPLTPGLEVHWAGPDLLDAILRLMRLLERPADAAVLAPMIEREVLWRLLQGPTGATVRQVALADSRLARISRTVNWLRAHYPEPVRVEDLARLADMSAASFHRHFKAVTAMSPLQYQKTLRLQQARARLLAQPGDVARVGSAVGYDSPSQFSREYARLFGAPPARDAARLRRRPATELSVV